MAGLAASVAVPTTVNAAPSRSLPVSSVVVSWSGAAGKTVVLRHRVKLLAAGHGPSAWDRFKNPASSRKPHPNYTVPCFEDGSSSKPCIQASLAAINHERAREGVRPMVLPSGFASMTPAAQMFEVTQAERVDRGLPAIEGLSGYLNHRAALGAQSNTDPSLLGNLLPGVTRWLGYVSNWAEDYNALTTDYDWMYNDGQGSGNVDCKTPHSKGCWGHRENILSLIPGEATIAGGAVRAAKSAVLRAFSLIAVGVDGRSALSRPNEPGLVRWSFNPPTAGGYRGWSATWGDAPVPTAPQYTKAHTGFLDLGTRPAGHYVVTLTFYFGNGVRSTVTSPVSRLIRRR